MNEEPQAENEPEASTQSERIRLECVQARKISREAADRMRQTVKECRERADNALAVYRR